MQNLKSSDFRVGESIGKGAYGEVFKGEFKRDAKPCAIKIIDLTGADDEMADIEQEIKVLSSCHCEQLTSYYGSFLAGRKGEQLWVVMEYVAGGSCADMISPQALGPIRNENALSVIMHQLLTGLDYLHSSRKIHRDVKAANILLTEDGEVRLADFGATGQLTDSVTKRETKVGTPLWMAPEVIMESKYDASADIWSVGITAIELATGVPPLHDWVPMKALFEIPRDTHRPGLSSDAPWSKDIRDFVEQCLQKDPAKRPTARKLLADSKFVRQGARHSKGSVLRQLVEEHGKQKAESSVVMRGGRSCGRRGHLASRRAGTAEEFMDAAGGGRTEPAGDIGRLSGGGTGDKGGGHAIAPKPPAWSFASETAAGDAAVAADAALLGDDFAASTPAVDDTAAQREQRECFERVRDCRPPPGAASALAAEATCATAPPPFNALEFVHEVQQLAESLHPADDGMSQLAEQRRPAQPTAEAEAETDAATALTTIGLAHTALSDLLISVDLEDAENAPRAVDAIRQMKNALDAMQGALPGGQLTLAFIAHLMLGAKTSAQPELRQLHAQPARWIEGCLPDAAVDCDGERAVDRAALMVAMTDSLRS